MFVSAIQWTEKFCIVCFPNKELKNSLNSQYKVTHTLRNKGILFHLLFKVAFKLFINVVYKADGWEQVF